MDKLVSCWADGKKLPENYIFPPGQRPDNHLVPTSNSIPVIDLGKAEGDDHKIIVQQILEAAQEFGFFQVINHGVPRKLMDDARGIFGGFFELPGEEKLEFFSMDMDKKCALYTSNVEYAREKVHLWKDSLRICCTPLEECMEHWPVKPPAFRDIAAEYIVKVTDLASRILELISQGLGLESGYFENGLSQHPLLLINHYPPCPDPSLTLGAAKHCDPNLINVLLQDSIPGLQVLKDGEWIGVEPIPDAFVINMGHAMQIVSNGILSSVEHRVVTNANEARTSAAFFISPAENCDIQPAEALIMAEKSPIYKTVRFEDLFKNFREAYRGKIEYGLDKFLIKA